MPPAARAGWVGSPAVPQPDEPDHFTCPFCNSHEVDRLYLASLRLDSCACLSCGARWDEDSGSGEFRGRGSRSSILGPRQH